MRSKKEKRQAEKRRRLGRKGMRERERERERDRERERERERERGFSINRCKESKVTIT